MLPTNKIARTAADISVNLCGAAGVGTAFCDGRHGWLSTLRGSGPGYVVLQLIDEYFLLADHGFHKVTD